MRLTAVFQRYLFNGLLFIIAYGLKCYACHDDDEFDCGESPTHKEVDCPESNSCSKTTIGGGKFNSFTIQKFTQAILYITTQARLMFYLLLI